MPNLAPLVEMFASDTCTMFSPAVVASSSDPLLLLTVSDRDQNVAVGMSVPLDRRDSILDLARASYSSPPESVEDADVEGSFGFAVPCAGLCQVLEALLWGGGW